MGKSLLSEHHSQFIGLYMGQLSREYVRQRVESADAVLHLGRQVTDFNTGGFSTQIDSSRCIAANFQQVHIRNHVYQGVNIKEFLEALGQLLEKPSPERVAGFDIRPARDLAFHSPTRPFKSQDGKLQISCVSCKLFLLNSSFSHCCLCSRFFDCLVHVIPQNAIVVAETGNAVYG